MMELFMSAMVGVTAAIAVAALGLALVANRRLRLLQKQLGPLGIVDDLPAPGDPVPEFAVETTDGGRVGTADLAGPDVMMLFVDGSCPTCFDAVTALRERPSDGEPRPIAVVIGQPSEVAGLVADLEPLARVVRETAHNGLPARFGVRGFPAVLMIGGGVVRTASHWFDQVELGVRA